MSKIINKLFFNSRGAPRSLVRVVLFDDLSECRTVFKIIVYAEGSVIRDPFKKWMESEKQNPGINYMNSWPIERKRIIEKGSLKKIKHIIVITNQYTLYVAELMKSHLVNLGFTVAIKNQYLSELDADLYLVICPQSFEVLPPPKKRIVYQMEQHVSSRWFTREYFNVLYNSLAVFDYAKCNIDFLVKNKIPQDQIFHMPIAPLADYPALAFNGHRFIAGVKKYDVLFYGDIKNKRRSKFLRELQKNFMVRVETNLFGRELYTAILQARVVVNIHYYEGAILESTRICECLSLGATVISEVSSNQGEHSDWEDRVIFTPVNDIQAMVRKIRLFLLKNNQIFNPQKSLQPQINANLAKAFGQLNIGACQN